MNLRHPASSLAALIVAGLVATGCTPAPTPSPSVSVTPSVSQTPTESTIERQQRLDYEAAEKSYRTFRAEYNRVLREGGAKEPSELMRETAGGSYLAEFTKAIEAYNGLGSYDSGTEKIIYVRGIGHSPEAVRLQVCEDSRAIQTFDKKGRSQGSGDILEITIEVRNDGRWKVWSGTGKRVELCS